MCNINISALTTGTSLMVFAPLYWVKVAGMSEQVMGLMMSGFGASTIVWSIILPYVSNRIGRRPVMCLFTLVLAIPFITLYFFHGMAAKALFLIFGGIASFLPPMIMSIIAIESVPKYVVSTTVAIIMAVGEVIGGALAPGLFGGLADKFGLPVVFLAITIALILASVVSLGLIETCPTVISKRASAAQASVNH